MTRNSENNNDDISRTKKKQQEIDAKENEIEEKLDSVSYKDVKESKKEAKTLGDSERG
jgi:hypothetical protein